MDAVLRERNPDRVADSVGEQAADPDGALDAAILAIAGLGDAEMNRDSSNPALPASSRATSRRYASIITFGLLAFIEKMKS